MIRTMLLAGVTSAALLAPGLARAQMVVVDPGAITQLVMQLRTAAQEVAQLRALYQTAMGTYEALAHGNFVGALAPILNMPGVRNAVPEAGDIKEILQTGASIYNLGSNVAGLAHEMLGKNQIYSPSGTDEIALALNGAAQSTASLQAIALQGLQISQSRLSGLNQLQMDIQGATDITQVAAIQARLQEEQNVAAVQQVQAQQLASLAMLQQQVQQQQVEQRHRRDADQFLSDAKADAGR